MNGSLIRKPVNVVVVKIGTLTQKRKHFDDPMMFLVDKLSTGSIMSLFIYFFYWNNELNSFHTVTKILN